MRHWIATALMIAGLSVVGLGTVGCANDSDMHRDNAAAMNDACPHCPGVQKATADGKCPVCGMPVTMNNRSNP